MSDVLENVSEQNSAQSKEAAAPSKETMEDVTINNVDSAVKAVPEAESENSATANSSGSKETEGKSSPPKVDSKKTPAKRTPSKRMSFIERAQKESEELVKNMGGSLEIEGGRRTRSSTRGTPTRSGIVSTPPPSKKTRVSPASGASTPTRPRARGRKLDVTEEVADEEETKPTPSKKKTPTKSKKSAAKQAPVDDEETEEKPVEANEAEKKPEEEKEDATAADKSNEAPTNVEETKKSADVVDQPNEDKTDASLEPVLEETNSQLEAAVVPTETKATKEPEIKSISEVPESVKSDSSMDTDDIKFIAETTTATEKVLVETKEPTPEPMEIDSSSNTNDDVVEIHDDDVVVQESRADLTNKNVSELTNNIEKIEEEKITGSSVALCANAAAPPADNVANANEINPATVAENDSNKTENDLCEPKIATSPPISAANDNSKVTTPQTCN